MESFVAKSKGVLVTDDTTLDKPYAEKMEMVTNHWSGKHHAVVMGININLISLLWTDGAAHFFYNHNQDGLTKNDHFQNTLKAAQERGFASECLFPFYNCVNPINLCYAPSRRFIRKTGLN